MENQGNTELILTQDVYQSTSEWNIQVDIAEQIIVYFPTLAPDTVNVLSHAIMNKLTQGVQYSDEMETMIRTVLPKVLEGLQQSSEEREKQSKRKMVRSPTPERYRMSPLKAQKQTKENFEKYYPQYDGEQVKQDIYRESGYQQQKIGNEERKRERFSHLEKILPSGKKTAEVLLDIGAGNAELTDYFGKNLKAKKIYAMDVYPENDFAQPTSDSNVIYKQIKDDHLPIPNHSVDLVMMMMLLHHINQDKKKKMFKEIRRVLKPGGLVFIREHDVPTGDREMVKYLDDVHSKFNPNPMEHSVEKTYYMSRKELGDLFSKEGFTHLYNSNYSGKNPQAIYHELYWLNQ
jgi:ubiquinone/menaquinone biosynthesis C-methylase UbiE